MKIVYKINVSTSRENLSDNIADLLFKKLFLEFKLKMFET